MKISDKIRELRLNKNETQQDLAKALNVTFQSVSKWENDTSIPTVDMLLNISKHFNVSVDYLLSGVESNIPIEEMETREFTPTYNKESFFSIYVDNDDATPSLLDKAYKRTKCPTKCCASSNKDDFVLACNKDGKIVYFGRRTGYGYCSPCDKYYFSNKYCDKVFILMDNYLPYPQGNKELLPWFNYEFVIPHGGFVLTFSDMIEGKQLIHFLFGNNFMEFVCYMFPSSADDVTMKYENETLKVTRPKNKVINNEIENKNNYDEDLIQELEDKIEELEDRIEELEDQLDDLMNNNN